MHRASCGVMPLCGITETLSDVESVRAVHLVNKYAKNIFYEINIRLIEITKKVRYNETKKQRNLFLDCFG